LVIHGDQRGFIWNDNRVDNAGIAPVLSEAGEQVSFADWYMGWLNASLAGENDLPMPTAIPWWQRGWRASRRRSRGQSMKPIVFTCEETMHSPPEQIARQILDLSLWPQFRGYGVLPGIRSAEFEHQTPEVVGTRIRVTNTDGSTHTEEIVAWEPERRVKLRMGAFSPPLSRLATGFDETWEFTPLGSMTRAVRLFELHPKSAWSRPTLWIISVLLKRAIAWHMRQIKAATRGAAS
jgi:hypothetical protein